MSHTGRSVLVMLISLSEQRLGSLSNLVRYCTLKVAMIGESISEFEVFKRRCVSHCCLLENTRRWVESLSCMVTKDTCSTKVRMLRRKMDAWIQKELRDSQYYGCTVAYKENNVYNIYMKPKGNKTDAMPLSEDSDNRSSGEVPSGSEPVRPENPDPKDPIGAHDLMRDDAMDGEELMVPRVPHLPPEPSARQIAEHELTGHAVYRSWCRLALRRRVESTHTLPQKELPEIGIDYRFFGRGGEDVLPILCVQCRNSSTGCLSATVVDRKGASDYASFASSGINQEFGVQENFGEIRH